MLYRIWKFGSVVCYLLGSSLLLSHCGAPSGEQDLEAYNVAYLEISGGGSVFDMGSVPVGESKTAIFKVTNTGRKVATEIQSTFQVSSFRYSGGTFPGIQGTCTSRLEVAESCVVEVEFAPMFAVSVEDSLRILFFNGIKHCTSDDRIPQLLLKAKGI